MQSGSQSLSTRGSGSLGSVAATAEPTSARAAVASQNASQPTYSARAPSGGVATAESPKITVAATATDRPDSSGGARSPAVT